MTAPSREWIGIVAVAGMCLLASYLAAAFICRPRSNDFRFTRTEWEAITANERLAPAQLDLEDERARWADAERGRLERLLPANVRVVENERGPWTLEVLPVGSCTRCGR